jgi:hypothetical protein
VSKLKIAEVEVRTSRVPTKLFQMTYEFDGPLSSKEPEFSSESVDKNLRLLQDIQIAAPLLSFAPYRLVFIVFKH